MKDRNQIKYVLYVRKSSESEDRQVQSIDDQKEVLEKLAKAKGLKIVAELEDSKSAKTPYQRDGFTKMLAMIERGEASGILCWQINRLSRNPAESGILQQMLQDEKVKSIQTHDREYLSDDNAIIFSVEASVGNQFIRDLRKNIKRGVEYKLRHGGLSGPALEGYLNSRDGDEATIVIDPVRFPILRKAFDTFLTGKYTVPELLRILNDDWGYKTRPRGSQKRSKDDDRRIIGGGPMSRSSLYNMLRNIRYTGWTPNIYDTNGGLFKATYPAVITLDEYDRVQELLGKRGCPRLATKKKFDLKGFIRCGECNYMITAERKKKKLVSGEVNYHTYYHCTYKGKTRCSQRTCVREEDLFSQVYELLDSYELTPKLYEWSVTVLNDLSKEEVKQRDDVQAMQFESIASVQKRLDNLLDALESGVMTPEVYKERSEKWQKELVRRQKEQKKTAERVKNWYEIVGKTLEILTSANEKFANGTINDKAEIVLTIGQNPVLLDGKLVITPNEWLIPVRDNAKRIRKELERVRTKPDKIQKASEEALLKSWCRV